MALKFHYNKTTIQLFRKQLAIRQRALPILKNKEMALRKAVKELINELESLENEATKINEKLDAFEPYWEEFPNILMLNKLSIAQKKIVGVKVQEIGEISFALADMSWWNYPAWVPAGIDIMKKTISIDVKLKISRAKIETLNSARKKTTQKVNLYEKVQIPAYEEAILKIKRFLEDKENISKAAQKIVKNRKERRIAA